MYSYTAVQLSQLPVQEVDGTGWLRFSDPCTSTVRLTSVHVLSICNCCLTVSKTGVSRNVLDANFADNPFHNATFMKRPPSAGGNGEIHPHSWTTYSARLS